MSTKLDIARTPGVPTGKPRIVVIGGGAGGLELVSRLARKLGRAGRAEITLVDRKMTHLWKPLFHEVAAGSRGLVGDELSYLSLGRIHGSRFRVGSVVAIDRERREITISGRTGRTGRMAIPERRIPYDYAVFAIGSAPETFGTPGIDANCYFLDNQTEAQRFREVFFEHCLRIDTMERPDEKTLTITIVGGGATGVELAAELHHSIARLTCYGFDAFDPASSVRIRVLEAGPRLLPQLDPQLSDMARDRLQSMDIKVITGCRVTRVDADGLVSTDKYGSLKSDLIAWVAGIGAPKALRDLGNLPLNQRGFLAARETLQTEGDDRVFGIGDCAHVMDPSSGRRLPPKAQVATQQAAFLAQALSNHIRRGTPFPPFRYKDNGSLVAIGRGSTIGKLMGNLVGQVTIDGWLARRVYNYLYRRHQLIVHGFLRGTLLILSEFFSERVHPRLKLH